MEIDAAFIAWPEQNADPAAVSLVNVGASWLKIILSAQTT
jgi:hypothetical protein